MAKVIYSINSTPFSDFGVSVESSEGVTNMLTRKPSITRNWQDYHGEQIDLSEPVFEPRNIVLNCNLIASSADDFLTKQNSFKAEFEKSNLQRLMIDFIANKPLVYEVYLSDGIDIQKRWRDGQMYGRFALRLREPEPVKKVVKFTGAITGNLVMTSNTPLNIYWGDGTNSLSQKGTLSLNHSYVGSGDKYAVITGMIEKITGFSTNGTLIWSKLQ